MSLNLTLVVIGQCFLRFSKITNWGKWSDIEAVRFPETESYDWLLRKISIIVWDVEVDLAWWVNCRVKLFRKRCSRNYAVPVFWLYFILLELKSPAKTAALLLTLIFDRSDSRNSYQEMYSWVYMVSLMNVYRWYPLSS